MTFPQNSTPVEVFCAYHRAMQASDACGRCGRFTCQRCKQENAYLCPLCFRHRKSAGGLGLGELLSEAWDAFCVHGWRLSLAGALVLLLPALLLVFVLFPTFSTCAVDRSAPPLPSLPFVFLLSGIYVGVFAFLWCGLVRMSHEALEGHAPPWVALFQPKAGLKAAMLFVFMVSPAWLLVASLGFLSTFEAPETWNWPLFLLGFVALLGVYVWLLPCVFLVNAWVEEPEMGVGEAFGLCMRSGRGRRWKILKVFLLMGVVQQVASFCCLFSFPAFVFNVLFQTALWKALTKP